jgi:hypothetical protein
MTKKILNEIRNNCALYSLLVFGFFLRLFYIFTFTKPDEYLFSDPGNYDFNAIKMASGQYVNFSTYYPPLFHIFLSFIYRSLIWLGLEAHRIKVDVVIFAAFYIIAFWFIYKIVEKLFSKKAALIVIIVLILWYPLIFMNYLVMSENLFFVLLFAGLYVLIVKPLKTISGLWLGLLWGFAFLCRPIFLLTIPLFLLWALYYKVNRKILLVFIITVAVMTLSMMMFNFWYTYGAEKSVSSSAGFNFAMGWCDAKSIGWQKDGYVFGFGSVSRLNYPDNKIIVTDVPFENQEYYYKIGMNCIKEHPERIITNFYSLTTLFNSGLFPSTKSIAGWDFLHQIFKFLTIFLFFYSLLVIFLLVTNKLKIDSFAKKNLYLMALIVFALFLTIYTQGTGEERYLIPYAPLLLIIAIPLIRQKSI